MGWTGIPSRKGRGKYKYSWWLHVIKTCQLNWPLASSTDLTFYLKQFIVFLEIVSDTKSQVNIKESCNDLGRGPVIAIKINFAFSLYKNSEHFTWIHPGSEFGFTFTW